MLVMAKGQRKVFFRWFCTEMPEATEDILCCASFYRRPSCSKGFQDHLSVHRQPWRRKVIRTVWSNHQLEKHCHRRRTCILSSSKWFQFLQNLWQKWRTRYPVYSICSILSRWLVSPPLLSCQPRGARPPLPSSRSSSATSRQRVLRVDIDLNLLQQREPEPTPGRPSIGSTRLCPSQEVIMVLRLGLLTAHHPLLDLLFVFTPPQLARTVAVLLPCLI